MLYLEARFRGKIVRWPLRPGAHVVGRGRDCDLILDDDSLSRNHFRISVSGEDVTIEDLSSLNGLWLDRSNVDVASIRPDQWFVAGTVAMAVRKGVTLTEDESAAMNGGVQPASVPEAASTQVVIDSASSMRPPEFAPQLSARLRQSETADEALQAVLESLAATYDASSIAVLLRIGNGWSLRALHGPSIGQEIEQHLFVDADARSRVLSVPTGSVLRYSLSAGSRWLGFILVHPWQGAETPGETLSLLAEICSWWLSSGEVSQHDNVDLAISPSQPSLPDDAPPFVTVSEECRGLLGQLDSVATTDLAVVLQGESGTGKELLARRLHSLSERSSGPFVAINCSAIPHNLLESELFGIEKGVATGVEPRSGRFVQASGGTLFLDEIGDLPGELQPKLLRALESGEVIPLGSPTAIPFNARIVSATNRDLMNDTTEGRFRSDLMYRLKGCLLHVPPLRERPDDILPLARHFAKGAATQQGKGFAGMDLEAARLILGYSWPGNVRELRQAMVRAVALADGGMLHPGLLPEEIVRRSDTALGDLLVGAGEDWRAARTRFDRYYFKQVLERCEGNLAQVSRVAGLSRSNLYRRLRELGLK